MIRSIIVILICFGFSMISQAATTNAAASASRADVQAAIDACVAEADTVHVPIGVVAWTTNVVINKSFGIRILSTNRTGLVLLDNLIGDSNNKHRCFFDFETVDGSKYWIDGFNFAAGTRTNTSWSAGAIGLWGFSHAVRVSFCTVSNIWNNGVFAEDWVLGVIDHSTFAFNRNQHGVFSHHRKWGGSTYDFGDGRFIDPFVFGTSNALVVEDCVFFNSDGFHGSYDGNGGATHVFRRNICYKETTGTHGTESGGRLRSPGPWEVYNNTFDAQGASWPNAMNFRGGTGICCSNSVTGFTYGIHYSAYRTYHPFPTWGGITGVNGWDSNSATIYWDGQHTGATGSQLSDGTPTIIASGTPFASANYTGYTLYTTNVTGNRDNYGQILSNSPNTLYLQQDTESSTADFISTNGWNYRIQLCYMAFGVPGRGTTDLLSGSNPTPIWLHETILPIYAWSNTHNGVLEGGVHIQTQFIRPGVEYTNDFIPVGYVPLTYPHPLVEAPPPPIPPSIISQPQSITVQVGQDALFDVVASGTAPLNYQWKRNGTDVTGATQSSYIRSNAQLSYSGEQYKVTVSNAGGNVTSSTATLTVINARPSNLVGDARLKGIWQLK